MLEIIEMVSIESLKRYLFGHPNPISGIISGSLVRLLVGKSYHKKRKMVIVCQLMIQLIIALIGFGQPKR